MNVERGNSIYDIIKERKLNYSFDKAGLVVTIPGSDEYSFYKLVESLTPQLQPIESRELFRLFTSLDFSDDLRNMHSLTGYDGEEEARLKIIRGPYPDNFFGESAKKNGEEYFPRIDDLQRINDLQKDRFLFLDLHSHPLKTWVCPSEQDLKILNGLTLRNFKRYEIIEYKFSKDFNPKNFRPIMGIVNFLDMDGNDLEILLLQCKKEAKEEELKEEKVEKFYANANERIVEDNHFLIKTLKSFFPYNVALLNYSWETGYFENGKFHRFEEPKYLLDKKDTKKLTKFT